jgi:threonine/homoserine/homoserine lactone efflux protein
MSYVTHLLLGYGLSFIGSLPFGIINMTTAHTAIRKGLTAALWFAFGASLVEFLQVLIALKFTWIITENPTTERALQTISILVFFGAGAYFLFFAKSKPPSTKPETPGKRRHELLKGMLVSTLNVMAIPYWIFYGTLLSAQGWLEKDNDLVLVFAAGTVLGTFSLLALYALLGDKILRKSEQVTRWVNKFIGLVLFGFGVYQLWSLWEGWTA